LFFFYIINFNKYIIKLINFFLKKKFIYIIIHIYNMSYSVFTQDLVTKFTDMVDGDEQARSQIQALVDSCVSTHLPAQTTTKKPRARKTATTTTSSTTEVVEKKQSTGKKNAYHFYVMCMMPRAVESGADSKQRMTWIGNQWKTETPESKLEFTQYAQDYNARLDALRASDPNFNDNRANHVRDVNAQVLTGTRFESVLHHKDAVEVATAPSVVQPAPVHVTPASAPVHVAPTPVSASVPASASSGKTRLSARK
jgi:hypothetical protein